MTNAVICAYARSPFTPANKGELAKTRPDDLLAQVIKGLLAKTPVKQEDIEDFLVGCAFPEGEQGLNIARLAGFIAGLPITARRRHGQPFLRLVDGNHPHGSRENRLRRRGVIHQRRRRIDDAHPDGRLQSLAQPESL